MIELKNTGPGCAGNVHGTMTQYRDTIVRPLTVVASTPFTWRAGIVPPYQTVLFNARFPTFSFDALGDGEYCPFVFVTLSWDTVACQTLR
jgi:hypothetical protein